MFMRETFTLKLGLSLSSSPVVLLESSYELVGSLRDEWAGADGSVAPVWGLGLAMTLEQDDGVAGVQLGEGKVFNVWEDSIEEELEVLNCRIDIMAFLSILAIMAWHVLILNVANIGVHVKNMNNKDHK